MSSTQPIQGTQSPPAQAHFNRNLSFNQTFESSLGEKNVSQKFQIDKSIIKGIKENDVSKIIYGDAGGRVQGQGGQGEYEEIQGIVIGTRKRYDQERTMAVKCEEIIEGLRKQKQLLLQSQSNLSQLMAQTQQNLSQTQKRLSSMSNLTTDILYRKQIYLHLKQTLKHDILILKKRYFSSQLSLKRNSIKLRSVSTEHSSKITMDRKISIMLKSVEKSANKNYRERQGRLTDVKMMLNSRLNAERMREIRDRQIREAIEGAMMGKMGDEKEWEKMLKANFGLKALLKDKMERLMKKYHKTQIAFHKIKHATNIKNSNEFIQKFLNRQQTYGLLLQSISHKQSQLAEQKQSHQQLLKISQKYQYKIQQYPNQPSKTAPNKLDFIQVKNPISILHDLNEEIMKIARNRQLIYQWGTKFLKNFMADQGNRKGKDEIMQKYGKNGNEGYRVKELVLDVIDKVKGFLGELQAQQDRDRKIQEAFLKNNPIKDDFMASELFEKNRRVKTLSNVDNEGQDEGLQDRDMIYDDISQKDYIQYNRRAIKKNDLSRKFRIKTNPIQKKTTN